MQRTTHNYQGGNMEHTVFEDVQEACSFALEIASSPRGYLFESRNDVWLSGGDGARSGRKFESWMNVSEAVQANWEEGREYIKTIAAELADVPPPEVKDRNRTRRWVNDDGEFDADRFLAGRDDAYQQLKRDTKAGDAGRVTLICGVACPWTTTPEEAAWRGAIACVLTDFFQEHGYPTELYTYGGFRELYPYSEEYRHCCYTLPVKKCGEMLELNTAANVTSPWFFRTMMFLMTQEHDREGQVASNLGFPITDKMEPVFAEDVEFSGDLILEIPQVFNEESSKTALQNLMGLLVQAQS